MGAKNKSFVVPVFAQEGSALTAKQASMSSIDGGKRRDAIKPPSSGLGRAGGGNHVGFVPFPTYRGAAGNRFQANGG